MSSLRQSLLRRSDYESVLTSILRRTDFHVGPLENIPNCLLYGELEDFLITIEFSNLAHFEGTLWLRVRDTTVDPSPVVAQWTVTR